MSRRKLTLLTAAVTLAVAGGATGAGASLAAPPPPVPPTVPGAPSVAPFPTSVADVQQAASPRPAVGAKADSPADCRTADCEIEIRDGMEIPLAGEHGVRLLKIDVNDTRVTFVVRTRTGKAVTTLDARNADSVAFINGITLRPYIAGDGDLMLAISHD
ncbi:hypothetical protein E1200_10590 [Actinomadura sp. GC306]|uniref:hypothetical protein n=1 Tax=Actinomadura sp. GC306 TaxID=2530367 RepID=UPI001044C948|nr:hypothetical protein [Actinomadura sp. GC306]TDC68794.1 hypothetical protein E1200_10590 [Actinomadura sp. GC306]